MKTEVEKLEGNKVKLKVEVPSKVLDRALKDTYRDLAKRLYVPGFRKGKVPAKVIDAQVGKETVIGRAAETIINARYPEAIVRSGVDPVEQPQVEVVQAEPGKDLIFEADIEVKPDAKLGTYKGVSATVPDADVSEEELDQQLDILRQRFARLDVVDGRPVEQGDHVLVDYEGTLNGQPFDGSSSQDYMVEVGSGVLLKDLEEGIVGMKKGENRTISAKFPEDFRNEAIAGKDAEFEVTVKEIKTKILPEVDDEFVSEMTEHDTHADLMEDLSRKLGVMKQAQTKMRAETAVLKALTDEAEVDIPEKLVDVELDTMMREMEESLKRQGATVEEYLKVTKSTMEKVREEFKTEAEARIKRELAIIAVAKAENLEVPQEEITAEIVEIAQAVGKPLAEVQQQIAQKGTLPELHASLLRRKTLDWICLNANVETESGKKFDMAPPTADGAPESADVSESAAGVEEPQEEKTAEAESQGGGKNE